MKKLLWLFLFLCSLIILLTSIALTSKPVEWIASRLMLAYTGETFKYENLRWNDGQLIFENPLITSPVYIRADTLTIIPTIDFQDHSLQLEFHLQKPHCTLSLSDDEKILKAIPILQSAWIQPSIRITEGTLSWDSAHQQESIECLFHLSNQNNIPILAAHFQHASLSGLFRLLQEKFPALATIKVSSGLIDGDLSIAFHDSSYPLIEGEFEILNATYYIDQAHLAGTFGKLDAKLEPQKAHISFSGDSEIHSTEQAWQLNNLYAEINYQESQSLHVEATANAVTPLHPSFHLKSHIAMESLNKIEAQFHANSELKLAINENQLSIDCRDLSANEGQFFLNLFQSFYPHSHSCHWESGRIDSSIQISHDKGCISQLSIPTFAGSQIQIFCPEKNVSCTLPDIFGCGRVDFTSPLWKESIEANVDIQGAAIHFLKSPLPSISGINTHLSMTKGIIPLSLIKLQIGDLKGRIDFRWDPDNHQLTMNLDGKLTDLADLISEEDRSLFTRTFQNHHLGITATIEKEEIKGVAHVGEEGLAHKEIIHFGAILGEQIKGWFYAPHIPVEKYISPFIFPTGAAELKGVAEMQGSFNSDFVEVKYESNHLTIENRYLRMERPSPLPNSQRPLSGYHRFNFVDKTYEGYLPLENTTYLEKNTGLIFNHISSTVHFKKGITHLNDLEAFSEGIHFFGSAELDYRDPAPGVFDVHFKLPQFEGTIEQIQKFLSQLEAPESFEKLPLSGKVIARSYGALIDFYFTPLEDRIQGKLQASLMNGAADFPSLHLALRDLSADIDYDHHTKNLKFGDFQGSCLVGNADKMAEYLISDSHLTFKDFAQHEFDIDMFLFEEKNEKAHLIGEGFCNADRLIEFHIDRDLTHIAQIHPKKFHLLLKENGEIVQWDLSLKFPLSPFLNYLQRYNGMDWLFLSKQMIKRASQLNLGGGEFNFDIGYREGIFDYEINGRDLACHSINFQNFQILGKKQDRKWIIEDLLLDRLQLSAEIFPQDEEWKIQFLGLKYGDHFLLGLDGYWNEESNQLDTQIHLLEYSIEGERIFEEWLPNLIPKGKILGEGTMSITLLPFSPWFEFQTQLNLTVDDWPLGDCVLSPQEPFKAKFHSNQGLTVENLHLQLKKETLPPSRLYCKTFNYSPNDKDWEVQELDLFFPKTAFAPLVFYFQNCFSNYLSSETAEQLSQLKENEDFRGMLNMKKHDDQFFSSLKLAEGNYRIKEKSYYLTGTNIELWPNKLLISTQTACERCQLFIQSECTWPKIDRGETIITDLNLSNKTIPLHIIWKNNFDKIELQSISGTCSGISCQLERSENSCLQGFAEIDFNRAQRLMTSFHAEIFNKLGINSTYRFEGKWEWKGEIGGSLMDQLYFQGKLAGNKSFLKNYEIEKIEADINYSPLLARIENTQFRDPAGILTCDRCICSRADTQSPWSAWIPQLCIKNFRPTLLKECGEEQRFPGKARSLLVRRIELNDFYGELDNVITWQGEGQLHFCNPSRKNCPNPLFTIPSELILRLGLDPHVLNPVSGSIYFNLMGDKFYLNRFKDMYSEGRGSKFFLDTQNGPSWMNLEGKLNINVRMRQDNLLFKIAELFSVSIQGTITKPKYNLQKAYSSKKRRL